LATVSASRQGVGVGVGDVICNRGDMMVLAMESVKVLVIYTFTATNIFTKHRIRQQSPTTSPTASPTTSPTTVANHVAHRRVRPRRPHHPRPQSPIPSPTSSHKQSSKTSPAASPGNSLADTDSEPTANTVPARVIDAVHYQQHHRLHREGYGTSYWLQLPTRLSWKSPKTKLLIRVALCIWQHGDCLDKMQLAAARLRLNLSRCSNVCARRWESIA